MTATTGRRPAPAGHRLDPIRAAVAAAFGADHPPELTPGLLVTDPAGWIPARGLVDGSGLSDLLLAAGRRWDAEPHVIAAQVWKSYTYALVLPVVLGWGTARRVPLVHPPDVLVRVREPQHRTPIVLGMRPSVRVALLSTDPLAGTDLAGVQVVADEQALLAALRAATLEAHLGPMLAGLRSGVRLGTRTLLGSLASAVAYAALRAAGAGGGPVEALAGPLLGALGVQDLVELVADPSGRFTVRRKTCCLAFTLPRPTVCRGCCIPVGRAGPGGRAA